MMATKKPAKKNAKGTSKTVSSAGPAKKASAGSKKSISASSMSYLEATAASMAPKKRVESVRMGTSALLSDDEHMQRALQILSNSAETVEIRLAALQSLQAATFSAVRFEGYRKDYTAALREVATDASEEIRQRVLGILSRENDPYAQKLLLEGLKSPSKALVHPAKALQLLSYNVHAGAFKIAKEMLEKASEPEVKVEALRLLSADASAAPMIERCFSDKSESEVVRQTAATAMHALQPEKLQEMARAVVLDKKESPEIQSMCMTALTSFGDPESLAKDKALKAQVNRMSAPSKAKSKSAAKDVKVLSAARFIAKFGSK